MSDYPKTKAEAMKRTYGFSFQNFPYRPKECAYTVWSGGRGNQPSQCSKKPGQGPDNLYCPIHAREIDYQEGKIERPKSKSELRWDADQARWLLDEAAREIAESVLHGRDTKPSLIRYIRAKEALAKASAKLRMKK